MLGVFDQREQNPHNCSLKPPDKFSGPVLQRKCNDSYILLVFCALNAVFILVCILGYVEGDTNRLSYGFDFRAEVCGTDDLSDRKFTYYPDRNDLNWSLCISACPYYYIENYYCLYSHDTKEISAEWGCWDSYETTPFGFFCVAVEWDPRKEGLEKLSEPVSVLKRSVGDVILAWDCIFIGVCVSLAVGIAVVLMFRSARTSILCFYICGSLTIILYMILVWLLVEAGNRSHRILCGEYGNLRPEYCDRSSEVFYYSIAVGAGVLAVVLLLRLLKHSRNLGIGISMIQQATKPVYALTGNIRFSLILFGFGSGFAIVLSLIICSILSIGSIVEEAVDAIPGGRGKQIQYTAEHYWMLYLSCFMIFWWLNLLNHLTDFIISGSVAIWYFSRQKGSLYVLFT